MSRIARAFERAASEGRVAVIPYLMTGFPSPGIEVELAEAVESAGADLLELGMPFSDPLADGPTIQKAATRSLEAGTTVAGCLDAAARVRARTEIPLVLMGYYNPILRYGVERFFRDAASAGVDGLILPDLPPDEAQDVRVAAKDCGVDLVFLVAPTSTDERLERAAKAGGGFLYCVSLTGVTGARESVAVGLSEFLERVRRHSELPLAVGIGISRPEHVREVAKVADGVVFGSALLDLIDKLEPEQLTHGVADYVRSLRDASGRPVAAGQDTKGLGRTRRGYSNAE